ncbi:MAG: lysophospholipid acyltransferase family protein, partial [Flavobacteriales bacterium]
MFRFFYRAYRWFIFLPLIIVITLFHGVLSIILSFITVKKRANYWGGQQWAKLVAKLTPVHPQLKGIEKVDPSSNYVIVPNHQSYYDVLLLYGWLPLDIRWMMKKELKYIPGIGFGSKAVGHIFIDRSSTSSA